MASSCASGSYTNASSSVWYPKGTTLKVDIFWCYELFRDIDWIRRTCYLASSLSGPQFLGFYLKLLVYETAVATLNDLMSRIFASSAERVSISRTSLNASNNLSFIGVGCVIT
ncbi:hypothetical protein TNCV_4817911 [Trichonephila clavipes]|nr:hypothetical protein TNCV_4817911 [Trichonephila clavipes]